MQRGKTKRFLQNDEMDENDAHDANDADAMDEHGDGKETSQAWQAPRIWRMGYATSHATMEYALGNAMRSLGDAMGNASVWS